MLVFFFKQKTAYEMRISDWSSDVCSSDLPLTSQDQPSVSIRAGEGPTRRGGAAGKKEFLHALLKARIHSREYSGSILDIPPARKRRTSSCVGPQDHQITRQHDPGNAVTVQPGQDRKAGVEGKSVSGRGKHG